MKLLRSHSGRMQHVILQWHFSQSQKYFWLCYGRQFHGYPSGGSTHHGDGDSKCAAYPCGKDWTNASMLSAPLLLSPEKTVNFGLSVAMTRTSVNFRRPVLSTDVQRNQRCTVSFEHCLLCLKCASNAVVWGCVMFFYWNTHFILSSFLYVSTEFLLHHHQFYFFPILFYCMWLPQL